MDEKGLGEFTLGYPAKPIYLANSISQKGNFQIIELCALFNNDDHIRNERAAMNIRRLIISVLAITTAAFAASSLAPKLSISRNSGRLAIDSKTASHQLPQYVIDKKKAKLAVLPPGEPLSSEMSAGWDRRRKKILPRHWQR